MDVVKYRFFTGHRFLTDQNEKNNIYFLYSEKLDNAKWKVCFSYERIEYKFNSMTYQSYGYGFASSDTLSYIVEVGSELRFAPFFMLKLLEDVERETLFGNKKTEQKNLFRTVDHFTIKEIYQDSICVDIYCV